MRLLKALCLVIVLVFSIIAQNLMKNGDFSSGMDNWTLGDYASVSKTSVVDGEFQITITTAQPEAWGVQLMQNGISLTQNKTYLLTFDAHADVAKDIFVSVGPGTDQKVTIPATKQSCTTSIVINQGSNPSARLDFNIGKTAGQLYLDNFVLKEFVPVPDTATLPVKNCKFPTGSRYPNGIKPSCFSQAEMNAHCLEWFKKWKSKYVTSQGCNAGEIRVQRIETGDANTNDCVSEAIGYGMIIMAYMFSDSNNTRPDFDGFWRFYCRYKDGNNLMNWRILKDGNVFYQAGAATDADEDVAFALFMAHRQWGSGDSINYFKEAVDLSNSILQHEINDSNDVRPGDGWDGANPSYFAPAYYTIFKKRTGLARWGDIAKHTYATIVDYYYKSQETYDSALQINTGLQPNWCDYPGGKKGPGEWSMDFNGYWWDACRAPWRQGYDYLLNGTANSDYAKTNESRISKYFKTKYNGDPSKIKSHYSLSGEETPWSGNPNPKLGAEDTMNLAGFVGSFAIAAMVEGDQKWLDTLYKRLVALPMCETGVDWGTDYFCDILKMLYVLVLSGNMPDFYTDFKVDPLSAVVPKTAMGAGVPVSPLTVRQAQSVVSISFSMPKDLSAPELKLQDVKGRILKTWHFTPSLALANCTASFDRSTLASGVYLVTLSTATRVQIGKLVLTKR